MFTFFQKLRMRWICRCKSHCCCCFRSFHIHWNGLGRISYSSLSLFFKKGVGTNVIYHSIIWVASSAAWLDNGMSLLNAFISRFFLLHATAFVVSSLSTNETQSITCGYSSCGVLFLSSAGTKRPPYYHYTIVYV